MYHCHFHPLEAANCCRNSRLAVDEDDLKWAVNKTKMVLLLKQFDENFRSKIPRFWEMKSLFTDAK